MMMRDVVEMVPSSRLEVTPSYFPPSYANISWCPAESANSHTGDTRGQDPTEQVPQIQLMI